MLQSRTLLTLLVAGLIAGAADAQPPAAELAALVAQLAADDYLARERAGAALLKAGDGAIPDLKDALAKVADPEARRRLEVVLERLESARLGEPRRVTLKVERKPAKEVFAEIAKQTGYKFRLDASPDNALVTFDWRGTPFLQAVDQLCDVLQLNANVEDPDGTVQIFDGDQLHPHAAYAGPFRIVATNVNSNRGLQVGGFSRKNPLARQPDYVNVGVTVSGEPKACLCALGQATVVRATDELKNSLLFGDPESAPGDDPRPAGPNADLPPPAFRNYSTGTSFALNRVARQADFVKECRVKVTAAVLAEARADVVVADVAKAAGQKFTGRTYLLEVGATGVQNNAATVGVTVRRKQVEPDDYNWMNAVQQRVEAYDAEGRLLRANGAIDSTQNQALNAVTLVLTFTKPGAQKPPKIARLQLVEWVVQYKPIEFTFKDLPLP